MQTRIDSPNSSHWDSPLLQDISFIKKHLRYPVNKRTLLTIIWIAGTAVLMITLTVVIILSAKDGNRKFDFTGKNILPFLAIGLVLFTVMLGIYRRIQTLRFISVSSDFMLTDNINLLQQFLQKQNIAFYHNPDAPEVFQIASRLLYADSEQREIMVFIADDKRIILNSHFTTEGGDRGLKEISSSENKRMAKNLKAWLELHQQQHYGQFNINRIGR